MCKIGKSHDRTHLFSSFKGRNQANNSVRLIQCIGGGMRAIGCRMEKQKGHQLVSKLIEYEGNGHYSVNTHLFKAPVASICRVHRSGMYAQSFGGWNASYWLEWGLKWVAVSWVLTMTMESSELHANDDEFTNNNQQYTLRRWELWGEVCCLAGEGGPAEILMSKLAGSGKSHCGCCVVQQSVAVCWLKAAASEQHKCVSEFEDSSCFSFFLPDRPSQHVTEPYK